MLEFIMMIGPAASGKSTIANNFSNKYKVISSDRLRKELYGDESIQGDNRFLFSQLHNMILETLCSGTCVVFDATNLSYKNRKSILEKIPTGIKKAAYVVVTPIEQIYKNNRNRTRQVPEEVIWRQICQFEMPTFSEGFDLIQVDYPFGYQYTLDEAFDLMKDFSQDNPNYSMDLFNHCMSTAGRLCIDSPSRVVLSAMLHDIGKVFTKTFTNMKGEKTDIAHYYSHNNVGSYISLLINQAKVPPITMAQIICYHMQPYFCKSERAMKRWKERLGEELWLDILMLHKADKEAH